MTTFATRSPLQLLSNAHIMSDSRRGTRRTSARLADKEDTPATNGVGEEKQAKVNGASSKQSKSTVNGHAGTSVISGGRPKRARKGKSLIAI